MLTDLERRLIYDMAQASGKPVGTVATQYGVEVDEDTGRLYRRAQEREEA